MTKLRIDAATWETLNRLLDEALEQPAATLPQWLDNLAPEFGALAPRLRELLSHRGALETGEFLRTLPRVEIESGGFVDDSPNAERPGSEIGPYRLVRELGSGGMGVVWLAERTDGLIKRPVALKLPHGAWKRAGLAERMAREREILATLTHPNIAHMYDAGLTADGQPYLAIEYVEGTRLDVYCRERGLDVKARLRLFAQVVRAVAYAHGKLVVHRDLKPANILVNAEGQARLLDFGIAKLLDEGQARETEFTALSGRALTPDYASPEQIVGAPITVASDVYSLGVMLYELLSGQRPYKLERDSRGELENAILRTEPPRPSEVGPDAWRKSLRGDLDTIVLAAMKKNPAERYATAHALLDDIERYLGARPVLAQPDGRWYRARKFVARNKLAVGAAAAIFLTMVVGAGLALWQARVALAEKSRAEEVQEFITAVFREADPTQGRGESLSAVELLLQAERRLLERTDVSAGLRVEMLAIIGESLFGLQANTEAARVIESALRLHRTASADPLLGARLHLALSQAYEYLGRNDESFAELEESFAALRAGGLTSSPIFVRAKLHEAALQLLRKDFAATERIANEAIAAATEVFGARCPEVATALQLLSKAFLFTHREALGVERSREALDLTLANYKGNHSHPRAIEAAQYYANALVHVGDYDGAAGILRDVMVKSESVLGRDSRTVGELSSVSFSAEIERGNVRAAVANARRSIAIYLKESKPETPVHAYRARLLGHSLVAARAGSEAVERLEEALRLSAAADRGMGAATARASYGLALAHVGRFSAAETELRRALEDAPPTSRGKHQAMRHMGTLMRLQGRYAESLEWLAKGIATASQEPMDSFDRNDVANGLLETGLVRLELGEIAQASESFEAAEALFSKSQRQHTSPARADLIVGVARVKMEQRDFTGALSSLQKADVFWKDFAPGNRWAGESALWLGRCYLALGRTAEAKEPLARAAKLLAASPIPADVQLAKLARVAR